MAPVMTIPDWSAAAGMASPSVPARVVRVAAGDLHHVDTELVEEALQLGNALDLQAPTANAQRNGGRSG